MTKCCPLCPWSRTHCSTSWYSLPASIHSVIFPWHKLCFNELITKCSQCPTVSSSINLIPSFILPYIRFFVSFFASFKGFLPCLHRSLIMSPYPFLFPHLLCLLFFSGSGGGLAGTSAFSLAMYWATNTPPFVWGMGEMGVKRGNGGVGCRSSSDKLSYWEG